MNNPISVRFKKIAENAIIPKYAKPGDAGLDLTATEVLDESFDRISYGTGLAVEIPEGYVGLIFPRSSVCRQDLALTNCVGVIDSGYRGEIRFVFTKTQGPNSRIYHPGDRIGQLIIMPYPKVEIIEAEELSTTERGQGGFGSSGT